MKKEEVKQTISEINELVAELQKTQATLTEAMKLLPQSAEKTIWMNKLKEQADKINGINNKASFLRFNMELLAGPEKESSNRQGSITFKENLPGNFVKAATAKDSIKATKTIMSFLKQHADNKSQFRETADEVRKNYSLISNYQKMISDVIQKLSGDNKNTKSIPPENGPTAAPLDTINAELIARNKRPS